MFIKHFLRLLIGFEFYILGEKEGLAFLSGLIT